MYTWHEGAYTAQQQRIHVHTRASPALPARCARAESLQQHQNLLKEKVSKEPLLLSWLQGERSLASACEGE